ncbi:MAG TPA: galactokinase [bacterium]|nr:galactokinase [bacterium]
MDLSERFETIFAHKPAIRAVAPGRVNLIGEHTDYNDGFVLPIAIQYAVTVLARPRTDGRVRLYSVDFGAESAFDTSREIPRDEKQPWSHYERGVFAGFLNRGITPCGADMLIHGDVPIGAGLSSSAAVEMATAVAVRAMNHLDLPQIELVKLAQEAENRFVGMNCGIMDQFISGMGQAGKALFLDCRSLDYERVPFPDDAFSVVILNTKKKRELTGSEYNERRSQCEQGVRLLRDKLPGIRALRDVSVSDFESHAHGLPERIRDRCSHVVFENDRVGSFVRALKERDTRRMGELFLASHESLRDLYAVSCPELDLMVEIAMDIDGVLGARMTGAGFGGCAIAVVKKGREKALEEAVFSRYPKETNLQPEVYVSLPSDGARVEILSD